MARKTPGKSPPIELLMPPGITRPATRGPGGVVRPGGIGDSPPADTVHAAEATFRPYLQDGAIFQVMGAESQRLRDDLLRHVLTRRQVDGPAGFFLMEVGFQRYLDPAFYAEFVKDVPLALRDGVLRVSFRDDSTDSEGGIEIPVLCFFLDTNCRSLRSINQKQRDLLYVTAIGGVLTFERTKRYKLEMKALFKETVRQIEREIAEAAARFGFPESEAKAAVIKALGGQVVQAPETTPPALPAKAPELYADRPKHPETGRRETIVQFLERVWRPWIESGALTRPDLRRLDPQADTALFNWERKPENTLPDHLRIPGKSEALREREAITSDDVRTARRILSRARRQKPAVSAKP